MFAGDVTETVTIGTIVVTIQNIGWKTLDKAEDLRSEWAIARQIKMGIDVGKAMQDREAKNKQKVADGTPEPEPDEETRRQARYQQYDRDTVIRAGVKSWTGTEKKLPAALEQLDEASSKVLHEAILDLSLPALVPSGEAVARKND